MIYQLTQYKTDGTAHRWTQGNKPSLTQLQECVGGLIERAPECYEHQQVIRALHRGTIDAIWCNEEALLVAEPTPNLAFEPAEWGDRLYGDVVVVETIQ